jgi:hypothetical protein
MLNLLNLDPATRTKMIEEYDAEQSRWPYIPPTLSVFGRSIWPGVMREAIVNGDDHTLNLVLLHAPGVFNPQEEYRRGGTVRLRALNPVQAAERLATSEFNTWYVRGFAARCLAEGIDTLQVYRAAEAKWAPAECSTHEGMVVSTRAVYDGHRARYWPVKQPDAFSIPFQPGCHHSVRTVQAVVAADPRTSVGGVAPGYYGDS